MSACADARTWVTVPGAELARSVHSVWIESRMTRAGGAAVAEGGENVLDAGFGGELDRGVGEAEAFGAQPDLGNRFLAGDVDDRAPVTGQRARNLEEERRLADTRDRRRPAASTRAPALRRSPGRTRRSRIGSAALRWCRPRGPSSSMMRPLRWRPVDGPEAMPDAVPSSTSEFHSPQSSQRPCQRDDTAPQFWQVNCTLARVASLAT